MALLDYQSGMKDGEILVFSDLAEDDIIPVPLLFRDWEQMPALEKMAIDHCKGRILDIGAGAGAHSKVLQLMGRELTSIDISPGAVEAMQAQKLKDVRHLDVFELRGEKFDTLLLLMNGIGIVEDLHGLERFLLHSRDLLESGGQILLDSSDLMYLYPSEDIAINQPDYYGQVRFTMRYKSSSSDEFGWLYLDQDLLFGYAEACAYTCEILFEGKHYEYLARLEKID